MLTGYISTRSASRRDCYFTLPRRIASIFVSTRSTSGRDYLFPSSQSGQTTLFQPALLLAEIATWRVLIILIPNSSFNPLCFWQRLLLAILTTVLTNTDMFQPALLLAEIATRLASTRGNQSGQVSTRSASGRDCYVLKLRCRLPSFSFQPALLLAEIATR